MVFADIPTAEQSEAFVVPQMEIDHPLPYTVWNLDFLERFLIHIHCKNRSFPGVDIALVPIVISIQECAPVSGLRDPVVTAQRGLVVERPPRIGLRRVHGEHRRIIGVVTVNQDNLKLVCDGVYSEPDFDPLEEPGIRIRERPDSSGSDVPQGHLGVDAADAEDALARPVQRPDHVRDVGLSGAFESGQRIVPEYGESVVVGIGWRLGWHEMAAVDEKTGFVALLEELLVGEVGAFDDGAPLLADSREPEL